MNLNAKQKSVTMFQARFREVEEPRLLRQGQLAQHMCLRLMPSLYSKDITPTTLKGFWFRGLNLDPKP